MDEINQNGYRDRYMIDNHNTTYIHGVNGSTTLDSVDSMNVNNMKKTTSDSMYRQSTNQNARYIGENTVVNNRVFTSELNLPAPHDEHSCEVVRLERTTGNMYSSQTEHEYNIADRYNEVPFRSPSRDNYQHYEPNVQTRAVGRNNSDFVSCDGNLNRNVAQEQHFSEARRNQNLDYGKFQERRINDGDSSHRNIPNHLNPVSFKSPPRVNHQYCEPNVQTSAIGRKHSDFISCNGDLNRNVVQEQHFSEARRNQNLNYGQFHERVINDRDISDRNVSNHFNSPARANVESYRHNNSDIHSCGKEFNGSYSDHQGKGKSTQVNTNIAAKPDSIDLLCDSMISKIGKLFGKMIEDVSSRFDKQFKNLVSDIERMDSRLDTRFSHLESLSVYQNDRLSNIESMNSNLEERLSNIERVNMEKRLSDIEYNYCSIGTEDNLKTADASTNTIIVSDLNSVKVPKRRSDDIYIGQAEPKYVSIGISTHEETVVKSVSNIDSDSLKSLLVLSTLDNVGDSTESSALPKKMVVISKTVGMPSIRDSFENVGDSTESSAISKEMVVISKAVGMPSIKDRCENVCDQTGSSALPKEMVVIPKAVGMPIINDSCENVGDQSESSAFAKKMVAIPKQVGMSSIIDTCIEYTEVTVIPNTEGISETFDISMAEASPDNSLFNSAASAPDQCNYDCAESNLDKVDKQYKIDWQVIKCFFCSEIGHFETECPFFTKDINFNSSLPNYNRNNEERKATKPP